MGPVIKSDLLRKNLFSVTLNDEELSKLLISFVDLDWSSGDILSETIRFTMLETEDMYSWNLLHTLMDSVKQKHYPLIRLEVLTKQGKTAKIMERQITNISFGTSFNWDDSTNLQTYSVNVDVI